MFKKKFIIRTNPAAKKEWRLISSILINWIFLPLFIIRGLARLGFASRQEYSESLIYNIYVYVGLPAALLSVLLNIIHWLKPSWFQNKKDETIELN